MMITLHQSNHKNTIYHDNIKELAYDLIVSLIVVLVNTTVCLACCTYRQEVSPHLPALFSAYICCVCFFCTITASVHHAYCCSSRCNVFEINKVFIIQKNENQAGFDSRLGITAGAHPHGSEIIPVAAACAHMSHHFVFSVGVCQEGTLSE